MEREEVGVGFPESVLTKDEQVVLHIHPHWKALILPVLVVIGVLVGVVAALIFMPASWSPVGLIAAGVIGLVLIVWLSSWPWLKWRTTHYVFINERVILREGVFSRD